MKALNHTIKNEMGIHARPAGLLVKEAAAYKSSVMVAKGEKSADAKKIFGIMMLGAKCGDTITLTISGEDEDEAAAKLKVFLEAQL
jgi:phosphocarrier protein